MGRQFQRQGAKKVVQRKAFIGGAALTADK
jgi:hypothetical protein